jgi:hypothetical protein
MNTRTANRISGVLGMQAALCPRVRECRRTAVSRDPLLISGGCLCPVSLNLRMGTGRVDMWMMTLLPREVAGLGRASSEWLPAPPILDRALPTPPKTSPIPPARWSPGQALVVVLIAQGALVFLQILLFALHVPAGQVSGRSGRSVPVASSL